MTNKHDGRKDALKMYNFYISIYVLIFDGVKHMPTTIRQYLLVFRSRTLHYRLYGEGRQPPKTSHVRSGTENRPQIFAWELDQPHQNREKKKRGKKPFLAGFCSVHLYRFRYSAAQRHDQRSLCTGLYKTCAVFCPSKLLFLFPFPEFSTSSFHKILLSVFTHKNQSSKNLCNNNTNKTKT